MSNFTICNNYIDFDTDLKEIFKLCEICDRYGYKIIQTIIPIGEYQKITSTMDNDQIRMSSFSRFDENKEIVEFLKSRNDPIGIHGLWYTHNPLLDEISQAKTILTNLGLKPTYFVPPFNEGNYQEEIIGLKIHQFLSGNDEQLENYFDGGIPNSSVVNLNSKNFSDGHNIFNQLDKCLSRLSGKIVQKPLYKLNLGGGKIKIDGFINVDLSPEADLKHNLNKPLPFDDGEVGEIMAIHVIESFYKFRFVEILKDWKRVLNGKLTIEFTDLDATVEMYLHGNRRQKMYGKWGIHSGQDTPQDPISFHHYVWTKQELNDVLLNAGFTDIEFTLENILHVPKRDWRVICKSSGGPNLV